MSCINYQVMFKISIELETTGFQVLIFKWIESKMKDCLQTTSNFEKYAIRKIGIYNYIVEKYICLKLFLNIYHM